MTPTEVDRQRPDHSEIFSIVEYMEDLMKIPEYNHAGVPAQFAIELWLAGKITSLADFEDSLRRMESRVHFLAVPLDYFGNEYVTEYPIKGSGAKPEHTLYVVVNGPKEAGDMLEKLKVTPTENGERLTKTGVLTANK